MLLIFFHIIPVFLDYICSLCLLESKSFNILLHFQLLKVVNSNVPPQCYLSRVTNMFLLYLFLHYSLKVVWFSFMFVGESLRFQTVCLVRKKRVFREVVRADICYINFFLWPSIREKYFPQMNEIYR